MHLGNGAITPECVALTYAVAAAGLGGCVLRSKTQWATISAEKLQSAAALGCLVFAAQAINVPVAAGTSAHLVGGVLLAWLLGPALGAWTMAIVLAAQAVLLGDGGIAALGANVLNMALLPAGMVGLAKRFSPSTVSLGIAASAAVFSAAGLIAVETALFRPLVELTGWTNFAAQMLSTHAWVGLFEGGLTIAIVGALAPLASSAKVQPVLRPALVGLSIIMLVAALTLPMSSSLPDGYEAAAQASGMAWLLK
jgi:cobalt/nickel transport system permease protein